MLTVITIRYIGILCEVFGLFAHYEKINQSSALLTILCLSESNGLFRSSALRFKPNAISQIKALERNACSSCRECKRDEVRLEYHSILPDQIENLGTL